MKPRKKEYSFAKPYSGDSRGGKAVVTPPGDGSSKASPATEVGHGRAHVENHRCDPEGHSRWSTVEARAALADLAASACPLRRSPIARTSFPRIHSWRRKLGWFHRPSGAMLRVGETIEPTTLRRLGTRAGMLSLTAGRSGRALPIVMLSLHKSIPYGYAAMKRFARGGTSTS